MKKNYLYICLFILVGNSHIQAQNNRIRTNNSVGWFQYMGSIKVNKHWGLHTEFQWRRNQIITDKLQDLLRVGVNYTPNAHTQVRVGYAFAETYPYGEYAINGFGKAFSEHRTYLMVQLNNKEGVVELAHRFMLEQRFIGKYATSTSAKEETFPLLNRARYQIRAQIPLKGKTIGLHTPYIALYNEILIGFGKNVNANVFDQSRIGASVGYKVNKNLKLEAGYLNQILQFGRQLNGKNIFQHNNGLVLNTSIALDATKK
jgi:hypothetical protein